jgi:ABC-2 type transport system ATP-binding protein
MPKWTRPRGDVPWPDDRPILSVRGMTKSFGARTVLADVDLTVGPGEAVAVTGPNGSGKTTLLRCVSGLDRASAGTLEVVGVPLREHDPDARRRIAAVLDDVEFFVDVPAIEHLALLLLAHGDRDPDAHAAKLLEEAGLGEIAMQLPVGLSSGQRRRLALLTCFARPRMLVVLDEPEQRLDHEGRRWLIRQLRREKELGHGVLLATHDRELTNDIADHMVELGRVLA